MPSSVMTKKILAEALKKLMESTPFSKISIGDITKECEMNRNSFYYHFQDKYEMLNWIFLTDITQDISQKEYDEASSWEIVHAICTFFYKNSAFYRNAMSFEGQNSFVSYLRELISDLMESRFKEFISDNDDPEFKEFFLDFFLDAFTNMLVRWVRSGVPYPPERFTEMFKKSLTGIAMRVLDEA